nr:O-methyltransferase [uncultured Desulfuromonas sp.]
MNDELQRLLAELEQFGQQNDEKTVDRAQRMLNITRDTGEFLSVLIRAMNARQVLEIGTSNGYSTLWLAEALYATEGVVTTVEYAEHKYRLAQQTFARTPLAARIQTIHGDAGELLAATDDAVYDLVFLDSERTEYPGWWPDLKRVLRPGGLLVVDNALSHVEQMAPFKALVDGDGEFTTCLVAVGKGEYLATRSPSASADRQKTT